MPVGAANLFSATDPKLAIYDYASSFFGGVAPLVSTCIAVVAPNDAALSCITYTRGSVNSACWDSDNATNC